MTEESLKPLKITRGLLAEGLIDKFLFKLQNRICTLTSEPKAPTAPTGSVGYPLEGKMRNIAFVRGSGSAVGYWRNLPNSLPVGMTVMDSVGEQVFQFEVVHVHMSLDKSVRVMCMVPLAGTVSPANVENGLLTRGETWWYKVNYTEAIKSPIEPQATAIYDANFCWMTVAAYSRPR